MNPYEILAVPRDADFTAIKTAYRNLARKHHPDLGGDAKLFAEINAAYDLLADGERRAEYDRTGRIDEPVKPEDVRARFIINDLFRQLLDQPDPTGRYTFNLVDRMKSMLTQGERDVPRMIKECQDRLFTLEKLNGRLEGAALRGILAQVIRQLESRIIFFENEIPAIHRAREMVDQCRHVPELDIASHYGPPMANRKL